MARIRSLPYRLTSGLFTAAFILAIAVYVGSGIPALRTVVDPIPDVDTREDRIEAMRVVGASNTIIIALLGIVLFFQVSKLFYALFSCLFGCTKLYTIEAHGLAISSVELVEDLH